MSIKFSIMIVMVLMTLATGQIKESLECGSVTIQCVCGIGEEKRFMDVEQRIYSVKDHETGQMKCAGFADPYQLCANHSCYVAPNQTFSDDKAMVSSRKQKSLVQWFYPQEFTIPRGGWNEGRRPARQSGPCHIPHLQNAEIKCWKWPNWMNCDIKCIHGYALQASKETVKLVNINCRLTENNWKPHGFQDCQPYVNCNATLTKPGKLKCKQPIDGPASCDISCLDYDQYEATSLQTYECHDETFERTLPHCATLRKGTLVRKPR